MTKVVIQKSHLRMSDEITYRRGDVVDMSAETIKRLGNSVAPLKDADASTDGIPEAMQKKDALIKSLNAKIASLELDIIALKDAAKAMSPVKQARKLVKP